MTPLKDALESLMLRSGLAKGAAGHRAVDIWEEVAGPAVAKKTAAVRVAGDVLYVDVDSPVWASQLTFMKADLLERINSRIGEEVLRDIRFRSRSIKRQTAAPEIAEGNVLQRAIQGTRPEKGDEQAAEEIVQAGSETGDSSLNSVMARLVSTHLRLRRARAAAGWSTCPACNRMYERKEGRCPACAPHRN